MLAAKFDPKSKFPSPMELDGGVFLDRDPATFHHVLNYLRNGCQVASNLPDEVLKDLRADADYFGLNGLKRACDIHLQAMGERRFQEGMERIRSNNERMTARDDNEKKSNFFGQFDQFVLIGGIVVFAIYLKSLQEDA
jgi:hypothetical protein